jgi:hypothetical protein
MGLCSTFVLTRDSPLYILHTLYVIMVITYNVCNTYSGESRVKTNLLHSPKIRFLYNTNRA